jgi:hypothetical protein
MLKLLLLMALAQSPVAEAHTGKSGTTLFATPPDGASTVPVVTQPVLYRDGRYTTLTPGPVSGGFWSWSLPAGTRLNPGDSLSLTAPAGWIDGAPALSLPVRNSAGQVEFPVPSPTMALGAGFARNPVDPTALYCPVRNWAVRLGAWDSNCLATDAAGLPTKTKGKTSARFVMADAQKVPTPSGFWTVVYDTTDPLTSVSLFAEFGAMWATQVRPDLGSAGVKGVGVTAVYQVFATPGSTAVSPRMLLTVDHPTGNPRLSNLAIFPPGNPPDRSDPLALEQSCWDALAIGGGRGPSVLRWNGATGTATGDADIVEPGDLASAAAGTWNRPGRALTASIAQIRPLDLAASPAILGTTWGDLPIPSKAIWDGGRVACEVVTAAPHGFRSGQLATLSVHADTPLVVTVAGSPVSVPIPWGLRTLVWVTSPTSFAVCLQGAGLPAKDVCDPDAAIAPVNATASVRVPGVALIPYEFAAAATSRFTGCACWISIPRAASDACVDEIGRRVLSRLGPTNRFVFELSNEPWNFGVPGFEYFTILSRLGVGGHAYVKRTAEVRDRLRAVFAAAGREADVLCALNVQEANAGAILSRAAELGFAADIVAWAPYRGLYGQAGQETGLALTATWTAAQMHDLIRHHIVLDPRSKTLQKGMADQIAAYEAAIGKRVLRYAYEAAIEQPIPAGSPNLEARTWDWLYHPDNADTERVYYATLQGMGLDCAIYSASWIEPRADGYVWGLWHWQGQRSGPGGRNVAMGWPGWTENESVRGAAWREWQRGYWLARVP